MEQRSLFGLSEHLEKLSDHGDPLEVLAATVDFEFFRSWTPATTSGEAYGAHIRRTLILVCSPSDSFSFAQIGSSLISG